LETLDAVDVNGVLLFGPLAELLGNLRFQERDLVVDSIKAGLLIFGYFKPVKGLLAA